MTAKRTLPLALAALLLSAPALALGAAPALPEGSADSCGVPCGYIYPLIIIQVENGGEVRPLAKGAALEVPAKLTFRFDVMNEGFTIPNPQEPIILTFEFPRKPGWVDMAVDPPRMEIPITPQYVQPNADDPNNLQAFYVYTTDIKVTIALKDQAVLRDGYDFEKLLVFAKTTESGLYKSGYGIKEFKVAPEGAIHESDLAPTEPLVVVDLPPAALAPITAVAPGLEVTLTPPGPLVEAWTPGTYTIHVERPDGSAIPAVVSATLLDASGAIAYNSGPRRADAGETSLNLTLPGPGRHTLAAFVAPAPGLDAPGFVPQVVTFPIEVAVPEGADAVRLPKEMRLDYRETVTDFRGNSEEPLFQFEKAIPFPALPGSSGGALTLALKSAHAGPAPTGVGNLNAQILDPQGAVILQGAVDAANPVRAFPLGALPGAGWFTLRVSGVGVPEETAYDARLVIQYDQRPVQRLVEAAPDATAPVAPVTLDRVNATIAVADAEPHLAPWSPAAVAVSIERDGEAYQHGVSYSITAVRESDGLPAYASGLRLGAGSLVGAFLPGPGRYSVLAYVAPDDVGPAFEPFVAERTLVVGDPSAMTLTPPASAAFADAGSYLVQGLDARPLMEFLVPDGSSGTPVSEVGGALAEEVELNGLRFVRLTGGPGTSGPGATVNVDASFEVDFPAASPVENPNFQGIAEQAPAKSFLPAPAAALAALAGAAAAALIGRRRQA